MFCTRRYEFKTNTCSIFYFDICTLYSINLECVLAATSYTAKYGIHSPPEGAIEHLIIGEDFSF